VKLTERLVLYATLVIAATFAIAGWIVVRHSDGAPGVVHDLVVYGSVLLVGALLLAWLFGRVVARPLMEVRESARALAQGDTSVRPPLSAPGEIGDIAAALTHISEQIGARLTALHAEDAFLTALFDSLGEGVLAVNRRMQIVEINEAARRILTITEPVPLPIEYFPRERALHAALNEALRGVTTESLEITLGDRTLSVTVRPLAPGGAVVTLFELTQLRRLETVRRDFVANVSHELRTPLTVVGGFAETLADDDVSPEDRKRFAEIIRTNTLRMQRIVDELLDLSRIESGGWVPRPTQIDLLDIAVDTIATNQDSARKKSVQLITDISPDTRTIYADRTALGQILSNFTENAIRHTAEGSVTIFSTPDPNRGGTWVGVRDTGHGIPPEHLSRIFERFYRADPGRARDVGGTGLGLAIVKHLVESHKGEVKAESIVGSGTTVSAWFPPRPEPV
jgi:two-component system phosphate regulon sensor histidine kinase PhoR